VNTYPLTDPIVFVFVLIPAILVAALLLGVGRASRALGEPSHARRRALALTAAAAAVWLTGTWLTARMGWLLRWDLNPPPFAGLVVCILALAIGVAWTPYGRRLALGVPLWTLVAFQGFRLPLELAMHELSERGIMPPQMTYTGRNFDIVTGATALILGFLLWKGKATRGVVIAWNVLGLALLVNVVTVAILATPRIRYFGNEDVNTFVMYAPFVWLPAVMVLAALAGHLLIFRALQDHQGRSEAAPPRSQTRRRSTIG
jgi:hypothetical protein